MKNAVNISRRLAIKLMVSTAGLAATGLASGLDTSNLTTRGVGADRYKSYRMTKLFHGVAYYPELWPENEVDRDIEEMKKLGINVVRMGEFAWSSMEPDEGNISLTFFRRVMDKMLAAHIDVVFCTPTPTPPIWLTHGHPERLFVNAEGKPLIHGARQHVSYEHPEVRKACFKIVDACAKALGAHPALIGWQIDNELKCHVEEDFSAAAIRAWHRWLQKRFGTIEALNQAWGTHIWSQHYQSFDQVPAPLPTPFLHNASLSTAYRLFCRESIVEFMDRQCEIIRQYSSAPITHNDNPAFSIHHERMVKNLDFIAYDAYPTEHQWGALVFRSDLYRAAIPGRPFWLMETSTAHNGSLVGHQPLHPPGFLAAEAALIYSLGGEAFCYWLWRQQRTGAELPHSAVMSAWFKPGIGYQSVRAVETTRKQLEPLLVASRPADAEVAVTWSDRSRAMIQTEPLDRREDFPGNYRGVIEFWQTLVRDLGLHRDVIFEGAALDGLKLLITPAMPYVSEDFIRRVETFVRAGGIWLAGPVTGTRDREHTVPTAAGLGLLDTFAGVETQFVFPLTGTAATGSAFDETVALSGWCAAVKPVQASTRTIGTLDGDQAGGLAFLTERRLGKGKVVLLSAHPHGKPGEVFIKKLIDRYAREAGVRLRFEVTPGTVVCPRVGDDGKALWIAINMDGKGGALTLPRRGADGVSGKKIAGGELKLKRYEWRAITVGAG